MASNKRIANLSASLSADTRDYEEGMKRAAKSTQDAQGSIGKSLGGIEKIGLKLGLGLVGGGGALSLLTSEIRSVIENIEKIPGVPASTIASIQQTRLAFSQSREGIDQAIAGVVSFVSWGARMAGFAGGALVYGLDAAKEAEKDFANEAERASQASRNVAEAAKLEAAAVQQAAQAQSRHAANVKEYNDSMASYEGAKARLDKSMAEYSQLGETEEEKLSRLNAEAAALRKVAASYRSVGDEISALAADAETIDRLTAAKKLQMEIAARSEGNLDNARNRLFGDVPDMPSSQIEDQNEKLLELERTAHRVGYAFEGAFEDAIFSGEKFSDVVENLGMQLLKMVTMQSVITPLSNWIGGGMTSFFNGLFKADGGPVSGGRPYIVGEEGPELFMPNASGMIIPNDKLGGGGGGGGNTYYIDARGADAGAVERIKQALFALAGPGVVEKRAMAAAYDQRRRG